MVSSICSVQLFSNFSHISLPGDSFNLLLAAASANGKLCHFIKRIIKCNQQSQVRVVPSLLSCSI
jgi:hypothetical protein